MNTLKQKLKDLEEILKKMGSLLVAYSGGVDSAFLTVVSQKVLGDKTFAVTALSETYPLEDIEEVKSFIKDFKLRHRFINTKELLDNNFKKNYPNRCYFCKRELFTKLNKLAQENGLKWVADGTNETDKDDFRPGSLAAKELGVRPPLKEAKLTKEEIRKLAKELGLKVWDRPASACLASRFPYGTVITKEKITQVYEAEKFLKKLGFKQVRVRYHEALYDSNFFLMARIEILRPDFPLVLQEEMVKKIVPKLKNLGYNYVSLDLEGYRLGSLNEVLTPVESGKLKVKS